MNQNLEFKIQISTTKMQDVRIEEIISMSDSRTILVTGGAGFIGSNIVAALRERGDAVVVCDRLRTGEKWRNIAKRQLDDVVEPESLLPWFEANGPSLDAVVHMGAISSTTDSGDRADQERFDPQGLLLNEQNLQL